jgi:hypothetical protein
VYGYDDETVLSAGRGFDPEDLSKSFLQCLSIDRESGVLVQDEPNFAKTKFAIAEVTTRDELYRSLGLDIAATVRSQVASASIDFSTRRSETIHGFRGH